MSQKLPNMLETTIQKIREMIDVNSVVGQPITTPDGVTIIPVSRVSVGFGGGGSDFANKSGENPFGGGVGGGVKVSPVCFLVIKDGNVELMNAAAPYDVKHALKDTVPKGKALFEKLKNLKKK